MSAALPSAEASRKTCEQIVLLLNFIA